MVPFVVFRRNGGVMGGVVGPSRLTIVNDGFAATAQLGASLGVPSYERCQACCASAAKRAACVLLNKPPARC